MGQSYFRRRKYKKFLIILISIACASVCSIIGYFTAGRLTRIDYENRLIEVTDRLNSYNRQVLVLNQSVMPGEIIDAGMVRTEQIYSDIEPAQYADSTDIGRTSLIYLVEGDILEKKLLKNSSLKEGLRSYRCREVALPDNVKDMEYCDIRLMYPNGTSYVVIAKVQLRDISENRSEFTMHVTEEELDLLLAASVDILEFEGSRFYIVSYVEGELQEASIVNYTPSEEVIRFLLKNPNIRKVASSYLSEQVRKEIVLRNEER